MCFHFEPVVSEAARDGCESDVMCFILKACEPTDIYLVLSD